MSNLFGRHCEQDLVHYLDGELSPRLARKVESHLESCEACRAELSELRNTLADCVVYQQELGANLPAAPQPWRDLSRDFSRIDESLANNSLLVRLIRPLVHSGVPRWTFVAGLATLIVLLSLNQLRQAPSVQAATLLKKAAAVSQSQPHTVRRIRVRSSRQPEFTRLTGVQAALVEVAQAQAVAALFSAAHWDWNNPLTAQAFETWRDQQVHKTDEVTSSEHQTRIRTVSADGEVEAASITIDTVDYAAVSERLEFRDREWVELSEIAETSTENAGGSGVANGGVPVRAAESPSRPAAFTPGSSASISDEIQVLSALSGIEADLGDYVKVTLDGGKVLVSGEGIPQRRQDEIRAAVTNLNLPQVEVAFTALPPVTLPSQVAASAIASGTLVSPMEAGIEKHLGGHAEFDRFSTELQGQIEVVTKHLFALHNLALKFPADEEVRLNAQDMNLLHELSRKHTAVLALKVSEMERILIPTLSSLGGAMATVRPASHANWQSAADDALKSATNVDHLVSQMLGMTKGTVPTGALPTDLLAAMKDLHGNLDDCQKLLK
jgi:anti-sigma factor RsiW